MSAKGLPCPPFQGMGGDGGRFPRADSPEAPLVLTEAFLSCPLSWSN